MKQIGIDLGTTHSLVCQYTESGAELIHNVHQECLTPSVVSVTDEGEILVGSAAKERLLSHPSLTAANFKRQMGSEKVFTLGEQTFTAIELSALVLKQLKQDAELALGESISEAVISVPAYFNDHQRKATKVAAELAGLSVSRLINEPTAAAIAYSLDRFDEANILVLDLGGGTFDVTVLELFDDIMEVHASSGDNHLGGEDFSAVIVNDICTNIHSELAELPAEQQSIIQRFADGVKVKLSSQPTVKETLHLNDKSYEYDLNRDQFALLCAPLMKRLSAPIEQAVRDCGIAIHQFDEIVLVGGSTRMPLIHSFVTKMFQRFPKIGGNPDQVIAQGAAMQAGLLARNEGLKEVVLTDVMPFSLGVGVHNESNPNNLLFSPIIERNKTIPISREELYSPIHEDQKEVNFKVFQGESMYARNNVKLGELTVKFDKDVTDKSIDIRFTYDNNGILEVIATQNGSKRKQVMVLQNGDKQLTDQQIKASLDKLTNLKIHPREQEENRLLIAKAERMYEQSLSSRRQYIQELMAQFDGLLASQDLRTIEKGRKNLSQRLNEIDGDVF